MTRVTPRIRLMVMVMQQSLVGETSLRNGLKTLTLGVTCLMLRVTETVFVMLLVTMPVETTGRGVVRVQGTVGLAVMAVLMMRVGIVELCLVRAKSRG